MSDLSIKLSWKRKEAVLEPLSYSTQHDIYYNDSLKIPADAAPDWGGQKEYTNPEQALAAALSSCHMMTFLALCAKAKWPVSQYEDYAVAHLGKNNKGQMSVTQIDLHPKITFDPDFEISQEDREKMHDRAHRYCFIANSLSDNVAVNVIL